MAGPDSSSPRILIADDQADIVEALRLLFKTEGYQTETARSPSAALKAIEAKELSLAFIDLNYARDTTSGVEGLDLLAKIRDVDPTLPVVVMTAWATVDIAVGAMRRGARDFVSKPWDNSRLLAIARTQIEFGKTLRTNRRLEQENQTLKSRPAARFIASSPAMQPVLELIQRVGPADANVLITGENGTGKGVVAQALHAASLRAAGPFVSVNMGGLPDGVFESELFGHVKGAFTDAKQDRVGRIELAQGGTLFLDEIGNIPQQQQAKMLRTLETGDFERIGSSRPLKADVRFISATNSDLQSDVAAGRFRQDLLFRLNTIHVHLPPLRERQEDIPLLAAHFLQHHARRYRKTISGFEPATLELLHAHPWPGNVRELDHAIERGVLMASTSLLRPSDVGLSATSRTPSLDEMNLEEVEAFLIRKTLARHNGSARLAAEALGLSRSAFYRRLEKYGL